LTITLLAALCLAFSYIVEIWGSFEPCKLCLIQRYTYASLILVGVMGYILKAKKIVCTIALFVLSGGFCVASYHCLVYFRLIESRCSSSISKIGDESIFLQSLSSRTSCSQKNLSILGMPAPSVNALIYLVGFVLIYKRSDSAHKISTNCD